MLSLSCDVIPGVPINLRVTEELSCPTTAVILVEGDEPLDAERLLGQEAIVEVASDDDPIRRWRLVVDEVHFVAADGNKFSFECYLVHPLARLARRIDIRMFQDKTVQDIVNEVLAGHALEALASWEVTRSLPQRVYTVQHRESDLAFISRLLEFDGIFYVCEDGLQEGKIRFLDSLDPVQPYDGDAGLVALRDAHGGGIGELWLEHSLTADAITLRDYNYETPNVDLTAESVFGDPLQAALYEYPGGYSEVAERDALLQIRSEEIIARRVVGHGSSDTAAFAPGAWFELEHAARESVNAKYLIRSVSHSFSVRDDDSRPYDYANSFTCSPSQQPYRPQRITPVPRIAGSQSVLVTGPSGEEIHTDELGRMKGKFFWDRLGKADDTSSRWMRVLQHPIGGSMALARVGWEMTVRFRDGDPDRPIGIYRVDNAAHTAPYGYPAAASAMAFKTLSSPGGGKHNEIKIEDGGGGQCFAITGSKDASETVCNNKTEQIAVNETITVGVDSSTTVGGSQTEDVGANLTKTVGGNMANAVTGDRTKSVGASETVTVSGGAKETIASTDSETVGGSHTTLSGLGISRSSGSSHSLTVGGSLISAAGLGVSVATLGASSETVGGAKIVACAAGVTESVVGAFAVNVGGVCLNAAGGNHVSSATSANAVNVGGVGLCAGGDAVQISAKTVTINVGGVAAFLGGGGILAMTPGSASFVGLVTIKASGALKIKGSPNAHT